jgi:DNA-binding transcriptional LysR family regulator
MYKPMMPRRRHAPLVALRAFEASARTLSFTLAAEELNVTQSAVSRHVKHLEDFVGQTLFARRARALELTRAGQAILPDLTQAFDTIDRALKTFDAGKEKRVITVSMPPTFAVRFGLNAICRFHRVVPDAEVQLHVNIDEADLRGRDIDIAIEHLPETAAGRRTLLERERLVPVCNPEMARRLRGQRFEQAIRQLPLLHVAQREGPYIDWRSWLAGAGIRDVDCERGLIVETGEMVINAVLDGEGLALAETLFVEKYLKTGALMLAHEYVHATGRGHFLSADLGAAPSPSAMVLFRWFADGTWRGDATGQPA